MFAMAAANVGWFDASLVCQSCEHKGWPCPCMARCPLCEMLYRVEDGRCTNRVHEYDKQVQNALMNGYWRIDENTGQLYKTHSFSIQHIYSELDKGMVFFSRREFNQLVKSSA
jgi:hypothetical protein